ncbi:hypothetical protein ACFQ14_12890 [Pseudahrensia aquimaris]|uniref:Uncharacterized protein n=1 Tax=Pseudahrensia aquimaris TaxID=744461 RepID=A0ABW3FGM4_9HYPH
MRSVLASILICLAASTHPMLALGETRIEPTRIVNFEGLWLPYQHGASLSLWGNDRASFGVERASDGGVKIWVYEASAEYEDTLPRGFLVFEGRQSETGLVGRWSRHLISCHSYSFDVQSTKAATSTQLSFSGEVREPAGEYCQHDDQNTATVEVLNFWRDAPMAVALNGYERQSTPFPLAEFQWLPDAAQTPLRFYETSKLRKVVGEVLPLQGEMSLYKRQCAPDQTKATNDDLECAAYVKIDHWQGWVDGEQIRSAVTAAQPPKG